jgi:excisionase family DNA binding protein
VEALLSAHRAQARPEAAERTTRKQSAATRSVPDGKAGTESVSESRPEVQSPQASLPGRGGEQHKYLQELIRRWGEGRGYQVTLEKSVLDGLGIVDVVLEKRGVNPIACEISVTTTADHELQNAAKCFAAGFEHVFLVAPDKDALNRVRARAPSILTAPQMKKVQFVLPEQVFASVSVLESRTGVPAAAPADSTADGSKELLTAKEVEELLRIDVKTIYSYAQRGLIPYVRIQSNLRFVKADVLAWVAEHRAGGRLSRKK